MSKAMTIKILVTVADDLSVHEVAESLFETLAQFADEDLIEAVDGWDE